ncbi:MAG TPA: hypothetical protein VI864_04945 [Candidatus Bathyarchaeia archaeon]|nr:hypothetical protein [Candidatus Bathyarchaeia archaeon]
MSKVKKHRRTVFGGRAFYTKYKTTTERGKREYMRKYMQAYRDRDRTRTYAPRKTRKR